MPSHIDPRDLKSNGDRLAELCRAARMTQRELATASGYSLVAIKKYEQGGRPLDRGQIILTLAQALGVNPAAITGHPFHSSADRDTAAAAAVVATVHRALLVHDRPPKISDAEVAAVDLAGLAARMAEAVAWRHASALTRTATVLPQLLRDLQVAVAVTQADANRRAWRLLAEGYECAMQWSYKMGHAAVSTLATERVLWSAQQTGDPLHEIAARWYLAGEYIGVGEHDVAADVIEEALVDLAARPESPQRLSLVGSFHLKSSFNAARAADSAGAETGLRHARAAADKLGADRNDYQLQFGPVNVAIWGVSTAVEFGRGREAVRRGERVQLPSGYAAERRCQLAIDLGRASWQNGDREGALIAFLEAESIARQQTHLHTGVRETLRSMRRSQQRGRLADLCLRVGVA